MTPLKSRIPSLDGLRALSIFLVILSHSAGTVNFPAPRWLLSDIIDLGNLGVRVFFVISGFLITSILLKEYQITGTVDLHRFYIRRFFRIFPAYYFFLSIITLLTLNHFIPTTANGLAHAFTYTENYHPRYTWGPGQWYIGHAWSLAVEEQFYLLWPGILLLSGPKKGLKIAMGFVFLSPLLRMLYSLGNLIPQIAHNAVFTFLQANQGRSFETVGDAIAIGCILAILRSNLWKKSWYRKIIHTKLFFLIFPFIFAMGALGGNLLKEVSGRLLFRYIYQFAGISLMNISIALVIEKYIRYPHKGLGKILNLPPVAFIGVLSYSIYIWQQPFLNRYSQHWTALFPYNWLLVITFACISYYLVEKPFLAYRKKHFHKTMPEQDIALPTTS